MAEQICVAVPYPVVGRLGSALMWGPVCPVHPDYMGGNVASDYTRVEADAFAEALACAHPDHAREAVPQAVINAVIVAVMRDEAFSQRSADMFAQFGDSHPYQYCDMFPVVHHAESFGEENEWGDLWAVEVQYSSKGGRAVYGVSRNHVPNCYAN